MTSERLDFIIPTPHHRRYYERMYGTPEMTEHLGGVLSPDEIAARHQKWIDHWKQHGFGPFITCLQGTGDVIGGSALFETSIHGESVLEIGGAIFPEFQKQGFAFEVARRLLDYARERFPNRPVIALPDVGNTASNYLCKKLGMTLRGQHDHTWAGDKVLHSAYWRVDW